MEWALRLTVALWSLGLVVVAMLLSTIPMTMLLPMIPETMLLANLAFSTRSLLQPYFSHRSVLETVRNQSVLWRAMLPTTDTSKGIRKQEQPIVRCPRSKLVTEDTGRLERVCPGSRSVGVL
jgi:hypothetical protein